VALLRERLLERLSLLEQDPARRGGPAAGRELASIRDHLQRLLNTRMGSVPIQAEYGIADFTHVAADTPSEAAQEMERQLRRLVARFEPRLGDVQVRFEPAEGGGLGLRFRIEGTLGGEARVPVSLETTVNPGGRARVAT
jgi:type VI secretion system protein